LFPLPYSPGFKQFFSNSNGLKKAILSGGIDIVARQIAKELNFDYWISESLEIKNGIFTGKGKSPVYFDKSEHLVPISRILKVPLSNTCYIGDTDSDIPCLRQVGFPVAFNPHHGLEDYVKLKKIPSISDFGELKGMLE
jgi:HAD superfamily phosphoserine phosphatase-like hydrolase